MTPATMRVYYDESGKIKFTVMGDSGPAGDWIEVEAVDLGDLTRWRVIDGLLEERSEWVDEELQRRRESAWLPNVAFFLAVKNMGILTAQEAAMGARGEIPPNIQAIIDTLPVPVQEDLIITFAGAERFERLDPFLLMFQQEFGITDEQADALFGIEVPE